MLIRIRKILLPKLEDFEDIEAKDDNDMEMFAQFVERVQEADQRTMQSVFDHIAVTSRWIFASLVSINGAAAIAVGSATGLPKASQAASIEAFVIGIVLAVVAGFASAVSAALLMGAIGETTALLIEMRSRKIFSREIQVMAARRATKGRMQTLIVVAIGASSLAAFVIGALHASASI